MKKSLFVFFALSLLLAACAPAAAPLPEATPDILGTTEALVKEIVSGTLTAMPTHTLPPTETASPSETPTPAATPTETPSPTPGITPTLPVFYGEFAPAGLPNDVYKGYVLFENESKISPIHLNFHGETEQGQRPYYYKWSFEGRQHRHHLPFGTYHYVIFVGERRMHSGTIRINNKDKTTFFIREENRLDIAGP